MNDDDQNNQNKNDEVPLSDDGGAGSVGGSEADLDTDDEVLDEAHKVGLYDQATDEGEGYQQEVGVAGEVNKDEREHEKED